MMKGRLFAMGIFFFGNFLIFSPPARSQSSLVYEIRAENAHIAREVMGEVTETVGDVPAVPVDSFTWDGEGYQSVKGKAYARLDPVENTGKIEVAWTDEHGNWKLEQTAFLKSPMPLGIRFGPSIEQMEKVRDAVISTVYMHGDTGAVDPMMPTLFAYVGTWGEGRVTLNGKPFKNPFDGPAPGWFIHSMVVTGVYDQNGRVTAGEGEVYAPEKSGQGETNFSDLEYQVIFFDAPGDDTASIPPVFKFAYHLIFEDVELKIEQKEN